MAEDGKSIGLTPPALTISEMTELHSPEKRTFHLAGTAHEDELDALRVYVDGLEQDSVKLVGSRWEADISIVTQWEGREEERGVPDPVKAMIIVMASGKNGRSAAEMRFV